MSTDKTINLIIMEQERQFTMRQLENIKEKLNMMDSAKELVQQTCKYH